jgi:hypothetical protein
MIERLQEAGLGLNFKSLSGVSGDALAPGHCAWLDKPIYQGNQSRSFLPATEVMVNPAVNKRKMGPPVHADPRLPAAKYAPANIVGLPYAP